MMMTLFLLLLTGATGLTAIGLEGQGLQVISPPSDLSVKPGQALVAPADIAIKIVDPPPSLVERSKYQRQVDNFDIRVGATFSFGGLEQAAVHSEPSAEARAVDLAVGKPILTVDDGIVVGKPADTFLPEKLHESEIPKHADDQESAVSKRVEIALPKQGESNEEFLPFFPSVKTPPAKPTQQPRIPLDVNHSRKENKVEERVDKVHGSYLNSGNRTDLNLPVETTLTQKAEAAEAIKSGVAVKGLGLSSQSYGPRPLGGDKVLQVPKLRDHANLPRILLPPLKSIRPTQTPSLVADGVRRSDSASPPRVKEPNRVKHQLVFVPIPVPNNQNPITTFSEPQKLSIPIGGGIPPKAEQRSSSDEEDDKESPMDSVKQTIASAKETILSAKEVISDVVNRKAGWVIDKIFKPKDSVSKDHDRADHEDHYSYDQKRVAPYYEDQLALPNRPENNFNQQPAASTYFKTQQFVVVPPSENQDPISTPEPTVIPLQRPSIPTTKNDMVVTQPIKFDFQSNEQSEDELSAGASKLTHERNFKPSIEVSRKKNNNLKPQSQEPPIVSKPQTSNLQMYPFTFEDISLSKKPNAPNKAELLAPGTFQIEKPENGLGQFGHELLGGAESRFKSFFKAENTKVSETDDPRDLSFRKYFGTNAPNIREVPAPNLATLTTSISSEISKEISNPFSKSTGPELADPQAVRHSYPDEAFEIPTTRHTPRRAENIRYLYPTFQGQSLGETLNVPPTQFPMSEEVQSELIQQVVPNNGYLSMQSAGDIPSSLPQHQLERPSAAEGLGSNHEAEQYARQSPHHPFLRTNSDGLLLPTVANHELVYNRDPSYYQGVNRQRWEDHLHRPEEPSVRHPLNGGSVQQGEENYTGSDRQPSRFESVHSGMPEKASSSNWNNNESRYTEVQPPVNESVHDVAKDHDMLDFISSHELEYVLGRLDLLDKSENREVKAAPYEQSHHLSSMLGADATGETLLNQPQHPHQLSLFEKEQYMQGEMSSQKNSGEQPTTPHFSNSAERGRAQTNSLVEIMPIFTQNGSVLPESKMNLDPAIYDMYDDMYSDGTHRSGAALASPFSEEKEDYEDYQDFEEETEPVPIYEEKERKKKKAYYNIHEKPLKYSPKGTMYSIIQGHSKVHVFGSNALYDKKTKHSESKSHLLATELQPKEAMRGYEQSTQNHFEPGETREAGNRESVQNSVLSAESTLNRNRPVFFAIRKQNGKAEKSAPESVALSDPFQYLEHLQNIGNGTRLLAKRKL